MSKLVLGKEPDSYEEMKKEHDDILNVIKEFFNDEEKAKLWMQLANPMLGNMTPIALIYTFRANKLKQWINTALEENEPFDFLPKEFKVSKCNLCKKPCGQPHCSFNNKKEGKK